MTGYLHPAYAAAFTEFGTPRHLTNCGGWILERTVPNSDYRDAMGLYPLFLCHHWKKLTEDMEILTNDLITFSLVADPFGDYKEQDLHTWFDQVIVMKDHYIVDFNRPVEEIVSSHHQRYARKALKKMEVEPCEEPSRFLSEWNTLYSLLVSRHKIQGIRKFSFESFKKQLAVPGAMMFLARQEGSIIGAHLWYLHGSVAYSHLVALSSGAYRIYASFALYWTALNWFFKKVERVDLGGGAGTHRVPEDGLAQFKEGWASYSLPAFFCGRILNHAAYETLIQAKTLKELDYFPAYRKGEF